MRARRDLTGLKFGRLTAKSWESINGKTKWNCTCECGREVSVGLTNLTLGKTKSCGCLHLEELSKRYLDLTGKRFGGLVAVCLDEERSVRGNGGKLMWHCICDCGRTTSVQTNNLRSGNTISCGDYSHRMINHEDVERSFRKVFLKYQGHAAEKGVAFGIDIQELAELCSLNCHYCGKEHSSSLINGRGRRNGIDCKDHSKGYVSGNMVPCCWTCNRMKGVLGYDEFLNQIKKIYSNLK